MYSPNGTGCRLRYSPTMSPSGPNTTLALIHSSSEIGRSPPASRYAPILAASAPIASATSGFKIGIGIEPTGRTFRPHDQINGALGNRPCQCQVHLDRWPVAH